MNNDSKETSEARDQKAIIMQAVMAYYSLLLNRGKENDAKEAERGWPTCGL